MTHDELEIGRRMARRRMAQVAFGIVCAQIILTWAVVVIFPERTEIATALMSVWPMILSTEAVLVSIILGYLGVSLIERVRSE